MKEIRFESKKVIRDYEVFSEIINSVNSSDQGYLKLDNNKSYIPLSVEIIGYNDDYIDVSFAHYKVLNGDLMADPEICFKYFKNGDISLYYYKNNFAYVETYIVSAKESLQILSFFNIWLSNIKQQQF